jgi:hypothetical protein
MPFEPSLIPDEMPDLHLRASLNDPELQELDFEGQAREAAEREAAEQPETQAAPAEEEPADQQDDGVYEEVGEPVNPAELWRALQETDSDDAQDQFYEAGMSAEEAVAAQEMFESLQELAEDDPLAALDYLAQVHAQQVHAQLDAQYRQELAPIQQAHYQQTAASTLDSISDELGADVVAANAPRVAEMIQASEGHYADPATQQARVREAFILAEHERQAAYARGDDVYAEMDRLPPVRTDAFGQVAAAPAPQQQGQPQQATAQPAAQAAPRSRPVSRPVHVEGGSTPPPPQRPSNVDPVITEMDATMPGRDIFGRLFQ